MNQEKPRMFIAEDSSIAQLYELMFSSQFGITTAETGREAWALVNQHPRFDVAIIDVVMPNENAEQGMEEIETTGLRLIDHMLSTAKCKRFLILTARHALSDQIEQLMRGRGFHRYLLKRDATDQSIREAITELMKEHMSIEDCPTGEWRRSVRSEMGTLAREVADALPNAQRLCSALCSLKHALAQVQGIGRSDSESKGLLKELHDFVSLHIIVDTSADPHVISAARSVQSAIEELWARSKAYKIE